MHESNARTVLARAGRPAAMSSRSLPISERDRRWALLEQLMADERLDALVLAANDYRGHKGTLRWVGDFNLSHRYGYAIAAPGREPRLLLPVNLAMSPLGSWPIQVDYARHMADGLTGALGALGSPRRIGVVGLGQVMKVDDYLALRAAFPDAEILDVSMAFERTRSVKTPEEIAGVREATEIAESCFERLLEVAGAGVTERAIGAEMAGRAIALGGDDLLFLTMYGTQAANGTVRGHFGAPRARELKDGDVLIFSFELTGQLGYWMEFARMVSVGAPSDLQQRMNAGVIAGMEAGAGAMQVGRAPADVQRAIVEAVARHGAKPAYWSGHGIGQDVIEEPWVGLDVVQDRDEVATLALQSTMVLSLHPYVIDEGEQAVGYMADTFVVGEQGASALSAVSREIKQV